MICIPEFRCDHEIIFLETKLIANPATGKPKKILIARCNECGWEKVGWGKIDDDD